MKLEGFTALKEIPSPLKTERPQLKELMKILGVQNWKAFGKGLGVASDFLKARSSEAGSDHQKMELILTEWMDYSPAKDVTWERVLEAAKKLNLAIEIEAIEDHLQKIKMLVCQSDHIALILTIIILIPDKICVTLLTFVK